VLSWQRYGRKLVIEPPTVSCQLLTFPES